MATTDYDHKSQRIAINKAMFGNDLNKWFITKVSNGKWVALPPTTVSPFRGHYNFHFNSGAEALEAFNDHG